MMDEYGDEEDGEEGSLDPSGFEAFV